MICQMTSLIMEIAAFIAVIRNYGQHMKFSTLIRYTADIEFH